MLPSEQLDSTLDSSTPVATPVSDASPPPLTPAVTAELTRLMRADPEPASVPEGFASQVLSTVAARGSAYGSPGDNHQTTADMLSSWLSRRLGMAIVLTAEDVCAINVIQKISRVAFCSKDDSWLDVAGYAENVAMIPLSKRNRR